MRCVIQHLYIIESSATFISCINVFKYIFLYDVSLKQSYYINLVCNLRILPLGWHGRSAPLYSIFSCVHLLIIYCPENMELVKYKL